MTTCILFSTYSFLRGKQYANYLYSQRKRLLNHSASTLVCIDEGKYPKMPFYRWVSSLANIPGHYTRLVRGSYIDLKGSYLLKAALERQYPSFWKKANLHTLISIIKMKLKCRLIQHDTTNSEPSPTQVGENLQSG